MKNNDFWQNQAKKFSYNVKAVNFDPIAEELELFFLDKIIVNCKSVCDLGCGNGRTIMELAKRKSNIDFYGIDSSKKMIETANRKKKELNLENVKFDSFDAASKKLLDLFDFKFDKVYTKRLLINLKGKDKIKAMENIHSLLKKNSEYIMIECFIEPLEKINKIRKKLNLEKINIHTFNEYLKNDFLVELNKKFEIKEKKDFNSLYYFISRIYNAYLSEGKPDYYAPINTLTAELIKNGINPIEGYSPETMYILSRK